MGLRDSLARMGVAVEVSVRKLSLAAPSAAVSDTRPHGVLEALPRAGDGCEAPQARQQKGTNVGHFLSAGWHLCLGASDSR